MRESVVKHLVCPETGRPFRLEVKRKEGDHVLEGQLITSGADGKVYAILGGVPRFVEVSRLGQEQRETVETFSYKWSRIPQYAFERETKENRERWYFERFGFARGDADVQDFLQGAEVALEAGTGTGVDTDMIVRNFGGLLFGIDISTAAETAFARFRDNERVVILQADIGRLPFRPGFFDVISCDQVLHHTPDPPGNFRGLARLLRPGGKFLLYVYKVKGALREFSDDYLRGRLTRAPLDECLTFCEKLTRLGRNLSHLHARVQVEDDIPELGITRGNYDVQRLLYDHVLKCFWNDAYDFETNVMVNFDWFRPTHAYRYSEEEVRQWGAGAHMEVHHWKVCPSGISTIMRKAA